MPKVLNKKPKGLPKNQKPITQFFKNVSVNPNEKTAVLPVDSARSLVKVVENVYTKRKAVSPPDASSCNGRDTETTNILQKKTKCTVEKLPIKIYDSHKENGEKTPDHSPIKIDNKNRSPLTTVTIDTNIEEALSGNTRSKGSPIKVSPKNAVSLSININNTTPKKSPIKEIFYSPKSCKYFNVKEVSDTELSPSKCGSTVKAKVLDFGEDDFVFEDDWIYETDEKSTEDLDLNRMQRCEIISVKRHQNRTELRLKNNKNNNGTCFVEGIWQDVPLCEGEIVSIIASRNTSGQFSVDNSSGLLVLRPDHLISSTSVVSGVFCRRKAVLQERWKGLDSANTAMTIGILIHELVQKALTENMSDVKRLRLEAEKLIKESVQLLYDAGLSMKEASSNMQTYISPLADFMQTYVLKTQMSKERPKDNWSGHIDKVLDIEENVCCPQLGLKGKIDATLEVTIHERKGRERAVVPLELKSGKASMSAEHRGQLVLYGMMISLQQMADPSTDLQTGLLLYLRDRVDLREVKCGYPERRDLIMLRNQLAQCLAIGSQQVDTEQLEDIEEASSLLQQKLPEPVHNERACSKCPYLTICSLHLWNTNGPTVSKEHPLSKLQNQALGHLSKVHIEYFLRWTTLITMEERGQRVTSPLHALWTQTPRERADRGACAAYLKLIVVQPSTDRYLHTFEKSNNSEPHNKGPQEGEFSIVSIDDRPWIAAGVVTFVDGKEIHILLERDLSRRLRKDTKYHIDTYESYATTVHNLTNLGVLMEDSDRSQVLRRLIIDKETPVFDPKLPRDVGRLGAKLMKCLNIEQQRAVLKALSSRHYALLQGLPGTGKTQTISVLIQMLVGLKQRVLVTAHTHSAVDTVLSRLPPSLRVMRLGSSRRVCASLAARTEERLSADCHTPEQLATLYESMDVIGVTCLGAAHAALLRNVFDVCIVDEATQVLQSTVIRPLLAAKRFVLVGDPEQLPPVVRSRSARRLGMEESLFHRLMNEEATSTLRLQYRMNEPLVQVANKVAYKSRLKCADSEVAKATITIDLKKLTVFPWLLKACSPEREYAAVFLDTRQIDSSGDNKNCSNAEEACLVIELVNSLRSGGVQACDIGVIAPFRDQVGLIRRLLTNVDVSTVDQFQGRDKSVIIYSCSKRTDGTDAKMSKEGEILNDQRRLAVSVTRAKHKFIVIGNSIALQRYKPLQTLMDSCAKLTIEKQELERVIGTHKHLCCNIE